jgi:peptidoglycan/xylan/chitin deacetylase (PgdA/CDA1 family)
MTDPRTRRFRAALDILGLSRAHYLAGALTRGSGVVFTLHHVRPEDGRAFAPNRLLEITPDFLEVVLGVLHDADYDVVTLDEAVERLQSGSERRFASFTFDDGYRDVRDHALPVLRRHGAPAALFVTTAFADGTGDLWWLGLEHAIQNMAEIRFDGETIDTSTPEKKYDAWNRLYWRLRAMDEMAMRAAIDELVRASGADTGDLARQLCLNWDELRDLAQDPLVTIGNHTVTHCMLAKHPESVARAELVDAQTRIARELNIVPRHLAYPVGDPTSAGAREFRMAKELGFTSALTTRLGVLYPEHRDHLTALPRVSLNGHYQERKYAEMFVSGLPFAINNRFRRVNVG